VYKETKLRSVVKTVSWRFWATITTIALVFIFIGEVKVALSIGFFEVILKMMIYFVHERVWDKVKFGRHEIQPAVIWLTGLVRAGKSEIAEKLAEKLKQRGMKVEHLDGHTIRHLIKETGFAPQEVNSHIKEIGYLASKLENHGIFVVASPLRKLFGWNQAQNLKP
jgi:adenylylsulfate kinase